MRYTNLACLLSAIYLSCNMEEDANNKSSVRKPIDKPAVEMPLPKKEKKIIERKKPSAPVSYRLVSGKKWMTKNEADSSLLHLVASINRTDIDHLHNQNILLPNDSSADIAFYMPFPLSVPL